MPNNNSIITEAIVLAGGLGTRLRTTVPDLPKCMAPVGGKPFLGYVIDYFQAQGINRFIFSLGYKHEIILSYLSRLSKSIEYVFLIEDEPLGTGGAIKLACTAVKERSALVLNGDTFFKIDLKSFGEFHHQVHADCSLALKPMKKFNRYGSVQLNHDQTIRTFLEKQEIDDGLINGGVYMLNAKKFLTENLPEKFSFEKDYLEKLTGSGKIFGFIQEGYFIDIGIPEDYQRAQLELPLQVSTGN